MEHFVAAFPAVDSGGTCGYLPPAAVQPGEWVAFLTFRSDSLAPRRVTVHYDSTGALTYYDDLRGDLSSGRVVRGPDGSMRLVLPTGRRTDISINLVRGFGLARNTGSGGPEETFAGVPEQMLDAPNLGRPRQMAALVRKRCY